MRVLQAQSQDIRALRKQGADSDARWRKTQKDVIHAVSRNSEEFRKEQVQAVCRSGEAEKQKLEDDAAAQKQQVEDRGEQEKARIDARQQQDVARIEAYRQREVARIKAHQKEMVEMMHCMSKAVAFEADLASGDQKYKDILQRSAYNVATTHTNSALQ